MTAKYSLLIKEVLNDPGAKKELAQATNPNEAATIAARLAKKHGFDVTPEELRQALTPPAGELSDSELETVVGGKGNDGSDDITGDGSVWAQFAYLVGNHTSSAYNDEIDAGKGNDTVWGGYGDDTLYGGEGNDSMDGGYGFEDTIDGGDYMDGGTGNDTMWGGIGEDELHGGEDDDQLHGNEDDDTVFGDAGNDRVYGDEGDDELHGGTGSDTLTGGQGNDTLEGGQGNDLFVFTNDSGTDTITDFDPAHDRLHFEGCYFADQLDVAAAGGKTFITYGDTTVIIEGQELTAKEVWNRTN